MRQITCVNTSQNIEGVFGEEVFTPFLLEDADGIYEESVNVKTTENTLMDGSIYQSSVLATRNIVLNLRDIDNHRSNRQFLLALFPPKAKGTLIFQDDTEKRQIDYYVEKVTSDGVNYARVYQVSLICPDPYFYDIDNKEVHLANYVSAFTFQHEFTELKEELGYRMSNKLINIRDDYGIDNIGLTIFIKATGAVKNPQVSRVESNEKIQIGTDTYPFEMQAGDVITITTDDNNKHIWLERNGERTNISQYLSEGSSFIQLMRGDNSIGYTAVSGADSMELSIIYRLRYASA